MTLHIFVAGATGVIGRRVVARLSEAGHRVTALTRSPDKSPLLSSLGATPAIGDAYDPDRLVELVAQASPDVVMHQLTDLSDLDSAANARLRHEGTANLIAASRAAGVHRVIAQSIAWAYAPTPSPAIESTPLDLDAAEPRHTTVAAVAALESAVQSVPDAVVLRYGMLYGSDTWFLPGQRHALAATEGRLAADQSITSFVHINDAVMAAVHALDWSSGLLNIVDDEPATGAEWVPDFCRFVGAPIPQPTDDRAEWAAGASNAAAKRLGWTPAHASWCGNWGATSLA